MVCSVVSAWRGKSWPTEVVVRYGPTNGIGGKKLVKRRVESKVFRRHTDTGPRGESVAPWHDGAAGLTMRVEVWGSTDEWNLYSWDGAAGRKLTGRSRETFVVKYFEIPLRKTNYLRPQILQGWPWGTNGTGTRRDFHEGKSPVQETTTTESYKHFFGRYYQGTARLGFCCFVFCLVCVFVSVRGKDIGLGELSVTKRKKHHLSFCLVARESLCVFVQSIPRSLQSVIRPPITT